MNAKSAAYISNYVNGASSYSERRIRKAAKSYPRLSEGRILLTYLASGRPVSFEARMSIQQLCVEAFKEAMES